MSSNNNFDRNLHISLPMIHVSGGELTSTSTVGVQIKRTSKSAIFLRGKKEINHQEGPPSINSRQSALHTQTQKSNGLTLRFIRKIFVEFRISLVFKITMGTYADNER
jgi:hypothetical protein